MPVLFEERFTNTLLTLPPEPARFQQSHESKSEIFQNDQVRFSVFLEELGGGNL